MSKFEARIDAVDGVRQNRGTRESVVDEIIHTVAQTKEEWIQARDLDAMGLKNSRRHGKRPGMKLQIS